MSAPFAQATNQMALGRAMDLEALDRQRTQEEQMARAQSVDRGFEMLGGSPAAQRRFQQAVERGGQQYNQAASQLGIQQAQAESQQQARADAMEAQGIGLRSQELQLASREKLQMQLAQLQAVQRQLDRQVQERLAKARNALQADSIRKQHAMATSQLKQRAREAAEQIATSQQRRGVGGGGGMTASYSTGASGFKDHLRRMGEMR